MLHTASNIRWIRLLSGKTQKEFGSMIGVKDNALGHYESGRTVPNDLVLAKIAAIAEITTEQLINTDLKTLTINVKNPQTKAMEFSLVPTSQGNDLAELQQLKQENEQLKNQVQELTAQVKLLKELVTRELEKS